MDAPETDRNLVETQVPDKEEEPVLRGVLFRDKIPKKLKKKETIYEPQLLGDP